MKQWFTDRHIYKLLRKIARTQAPDYLHHSDKSDELFKGVSKKATRLFRNRRTIGVFGRLPLLLEMVKAYRSRKYRGISVKKMLFIISALVYFLVPFDSIPDIIPVVGLVDDAAVIAFAIRMINEELDRFIEWKSSN